MKNLKGKKAILYRRVSTTEQKKTGNSLNSQKDKLRNFCYNKEIKIIKELIKFYNIDTVLDPEQSKLTPGNFIKFNYAFDEYNISPTDNFTDNLSKLLNLHKKNKDILFIDIVFYLSDFYFKNLKDQHYE